MFSVSLLRQIKLIWQLFLLNGNSGRNSEGRESVLQTNGTPLVYEAHLKSLKYLSATF